jgi:hypothetical protein
VVGVGVMGFDEATGVRLAAPLPGEFNLDTMVAI